MGYKPEDIRSIAIVAHGGAGKTSLTEAMLFDTGVINRLGSVENGNTVTDFGSEEQKRQISISTALANVEYGGKTIFMMDVPGYADFLGEMRSAMRVADSSLMVVSAVDGVEVQTGKAWEFAEDFGTPVAFFVNKMDRDNADYQRTVEDIREQLSKKAHSFFLPIGQESEFKGLIDVLREKAYIYKGDGSKDFDEVPVPADLKDTMNVQRGQLVENIVEEDDDMMMRYLDGEEIPLEEMWPLLRKAISERKIFPILPGSATANVGIMQLLGVIADELPSPLETRSRMAVDGEEEVEMSPDPSGPFSALCFKVMVDPYVGKLSFIRVNSGTLTSDQMIYNVNRQEEERISGFKIMQGKDGKDVKELTVGMIVAIPKLQSTRVGDTLSVKGATAVFPPIKFPLPVYSIAVDAKSRADEDKLSTAMHKMLEEDPILKFEKNAETGDNVLSGMGNLHLDIVLSRIKERYGVELEVRTPEVPYRETIRKTAKAQGKHKKQTGGHGQYGDVHIEFSPLPTGEGFVFEDKIVGGAVPKQYIPAVEKGLKEALDKGVLAGFRTVDFKATLVFGSYHDVDSSEMAFKTAAHLAFKKGISEANPVLLEPVMNVEVTVADDYLGDVMGDMNTRRGRIMGVDSMGRLQIVKAQVPLAEMFQYAIQLRSMTSGRGNFTMSYSHYDPVPEEISKKVIARRQSETEEE
ncbi:MULTISPECIES: elongation factor G [Dethiosulfovibrio]|uniref:Elongation factor G n=2 Tax=Dethiosulfovibrio TaxID=47054 RepID=A0ABS9EKT3_9BACT|nr:MULTISPECIES: elongation factor G [Dethiosulfovibrio]MCF4113771.1 elongation factor G [Dethiosulfovibrio russensis]MCF4141816.1 elongation factor G [Dethiosulfovibrio marinus]MCF4143766.1 elongation factor G [Dethiosulfovibrio acidaminovorans]MCF4150834.1 elongation factor G [Dethiosulfovibrio faecalis]